MNIKQITTFIILCVLLNGCNDGRYFKDGETVYIIHEKGAGEIKIGSCNLGDEPL